MKSKPKNPGLVWIKLTDEQQLQLQRHFDLVNWNDKQGRRGMLVAQVWEFRVECSGAGMCVGFLDADVAGKFRGAGSFRSVEIDVTGDSETLKQAATCHIANIPNPDFCVHPSKCQGRNSCPRRPVCSE